MRSQAALAIVASAVLLGPLAAPPAHAKSAIFEIRGRCPCAGPTLRTFWTSKDDRLACVDAVIEDLRGQGWPDELLVRDREREERSRCGDPRFACDGTPAMRCPRGTVCDVVDPNCRPEGATGTCLSRVKEARRCRNDPSRVCGCDGKTYATPCRLRRAGVAEAHADACAAGCGGPERRPCGAGEFCWAASTCDGGDARGVCAPLGRSCELPGEGSPVCGCDGQTYASICAIAAATVPLKTGRACEAE